MQRQCVTPMMNIGLPVGVTPMTSPSCVPDAVQRTAELQRREVEKLEIDAPDAEGDRDAAEREAEEAEPLVRGAADPGEGEVCAAKRA